jgi:YidC/Oxa1 family membrane protein insertase
VERRIVLFLTLSIAVLVGNYFVQMWLRGPQPPVAAKQDAGKKEPLKKAADSNKSDKGKKAEKEADIPEEAPKQPAEPPPPNLAEDDVPEQYFSLGSADPDSPYKMVATLVNRGAAIERIELNGTRYNALEERHGYLGYLAPENVKGGAIVRVVGAGTSAARAGILPGDIITGIDEIQITDAYGLVAALQDTKPGQDVKVTVRRDDQPKALTATLDRVPAQVIRPERNTEPLWVVKPNNHDPLSLLLTLDKIGKTQLGEDEVELPGVRLRNATWKGRQTDERTVEFERTIPRYDLKVIKRYQLAKADPELEGPQAAYHLMVTIELENLDQDNAQEVAYQLDGPNGLPTEGWWYLNRISTEWGSVGTRDVAMRFEGNPATLISSPSIAQDDVNTPLRKESQDALLVYAGVDSQYFSAVLLPQREQETVWLSEIKHLLVGDVPQEASHRKLTNVSVRLVSNPLQLGPGETKSHTYQLFVGPKQPALLAQYGTDSTTLNDLVYFGWAIWGAVARFLTNVLHFFYGMVGNYGIAIILLTVVVRLCMFPLSRKQALSSQKMQELQPEMKRINEKHKGNNEARARAMQELWKKHNYNPMGGCLLAFVQLPIFIGLYRSLMIDVELRGAPLFSEAIRWCSNLSAPDMLFYWGNWWPQALFGETGWLGPYFNVLPLFTVALFLAQQKMFMPPPTDEQSAMQQKVMTYMMVFMGVMFYKVASGLCLYFIASSLWGIGERKLLPKMIAKPSGAAPAQVATRTATVTAPATGNGAAKAAAARKKHRGRK